MGSMRPSIAKELRDHIEDRAKAYEAEGLEPDNARKKSFCSMENAVAIGTEINAVRRVQTILINMLFLFHFFGV